MSLVNMVDLNDYELSDYIGKGNYGEVRQLINKKDGQIYAVKISFDSFDESSAIDTREIKNISKLNHPSIVKFIGTSLYNNKRVIITEFLQNSSLDKMLELERKSKAPRIWNDTKKLCIIYGIASAMNYLHSKHIIHRDLKPANILLDDNLLPKLCDFGLSKDQRNDIQSQSRLKGTPPYLAPEVIVNLNYSTFGDVYSFSMIVYELMSGKQPFFGIKKMMTIFKKVVNKQRPELTNNIPEPYKILIQKCWDQEFLKRPSFKEILNYLRTNKDLISKSVNEEDFRKYVKYIDEYNNAFIKPDVSSDGECFMPIELDGLNKKCKSLIKKAQNDPNAQFIVGENLIEGKKDFPQNKEIGIQYLQQSINGKCIDAVIYFSRILFDGKLISENIEKAENILEEYLKSNNANVLALYGLIQKKKKDFNKARKYLFKAANSGNGEAMYEYAKIYQNGEGVKPDEARAAKYFEMAVEKGYGKAQELLDKANAQFAKERSENGDIDAMKQYSFYLKHGIGVEIDENEAARYTKMAADKGDVDSMYNYGNALKNGDGVDVDIEEACKYFQSAADKGSKEAQEELLSIKSKINEKKSNEEKLNEEELNEEELNEREIKEEELSEREIKEEELNEREIKEEELSEEELNEEELNEREIKEEELSEKESNDKENPEQLFKKAKEFEFGGDDIKINLINARKWYKKAADNGYVQGMIKYASMAFFGRGGCLNYEIALKYYKKASKEGSNIANYYCGLMYDHGNGTEINKEKAAKYYKKAADHGIKKAILNYALFLSKGIGVHQNQKEARKYYKMSADQGETRGMIEYGEMLQFGKGGKVDSIQAFKYYEKAMNAGDIYGMFKCAQILEKGEVIEADFKKAAHLYKKSADGGCKNAMVCYARMRKNGIGVSKNLQIAKEYYKKAANLGDKIAEEKYILLTKYINDNNNDGKKKEKEEIKEENKETDDDNMRKKDEDEDEDFESLAKKFHQTNYLLQFFK